MLTTFILAGKWLAILAMAGAVLAAIMAFVIAWSISDFFIPPRYNWSKSAYSVFVIKLGMAASAAFWTFISIIGLLDSMH